MATATQNPTEPVPLDTIPISPEGGNAEFQGGETNASETKAPVTVFHDADNFDAIHPLANRWTLWFTKPSTGKGDNWNDLLKEVITFESVEMFWSIWHNISKVSDLPVKSDYHLFKQGVRPEWEDQQNKAGGRWAYTTKERKNIPINELWLQAMLAAIGETLEDENDNEVMGVVVNIRKGFYRVGLWTRTTGRAVTGRTAEQGQDTLKRIGQRFKESMGIDASESVEFSAHADSQRSGSTRAKTNLVV